MFAAVHWRRRSLVVLAGPLINRPRPMAGAGPHLGRATSRLSRVSMIPPSDCWPMIAKLRRETRDFAFKEGRKLKRKQPFGICPPDLQLCGVVEKDIIDPAC